eukprot:3061165-Pleurochrysis_carterae.AAC.1
MPFPRSARSSIPLALSSACVRKFVSAPQQTRLAGCAPLTREGARAERAKRAPPAACLVRTRQQS